MKHIEGPWFINKDLYLISKDHRIVGHVADFNEQDAQLIAAAPEMLEALENLVQAIAECPEYVDAMKSHGFDIDVVDSIRTARKTIKKAQGEK